MPSVIEQPLDTRLSARLAAARPSATGAASARARELAAQGRSIISLSEGELDFDTPAHIRQAAALAMEQGQTRYTDVGGTPRLKAAVMHKFVRDNGLRYEAKEIIAATGAKQILFNAMLATVDAGDEVIVVAPYWVSYSEMVRIAGGEPVVLVPDAANDFKLTPEMLAAAITPRTRWLMLNAPGNPSGALYTEDEFRALAEVVARHPRLLVVADDIYEAIVFEGRFCSFAQAAPAMQARTLTINGVSKAYAMTGWRLGYAGGPAWLIKALELLQSQSTSNPSSVSQAAAVAALEGPQAFLDDWRQRLRARRDLALDILARAAPLLTMRRPPAAFYLYADCSATLGMRTPAGELIASDIDFARYLLEGAGVAVVPGTAFGLAPYVRLAYALSDERLREACERIVAACAALLPPESRP
ncbi:aminotransferase class I/II-fold pyridoxal phosphate-dependent enzyme [Xylophilus rhododendri]|uniref:Aminotransferase n=1 Tax=Xylophilus rhododendri TaxID=2697032 RepID=A0A857J9Q8_9BURK|nr:pyridoxal phosphate-dependent aminotransferase [Xylophilus rhododendri]QHI99478.1 aminotransferase class I/II-fold pyridoxal phosphate-dependent enzyme [Xylophilus rhododendri]